MNEEIPFTGLVFETYPNGNKEYSGEYNNGKPSGVLTYWYPNGNKMREGKLKDGSPVGRWKYYNKNGTIKNIVDN